MTGDLLCESVGLFPPQVVYKYNGDLERRIHANHANRSSYYAQEMEQAFSLNYPVKF